MLLTGHRKYKISETNGFNFKKDTAQVRRTQ